MSGNPLEAELAESQKRRENERKAKESRMIILVGLFVSAALIIAIDPLNLFHQAQKTKK